MQLNSISFLRPSTSLCEVFSNQFSHIPYPWIQFNVCFNFAKFPFIFFFVPPSAQLRIIFSGAESIWRRRWRQYGSRKYVTHFDHNACSDAQPSWTALGDSGHSRRRRTTNGYGDEMTFSHHPLLSLTHPFLSYLTLQLALHLVVSHTQSHPLSHRHKPRVND